MGVVELGEEMVVSGGDPVTVFSYLTGVYGADGARLDGRNKRTGNNGND